MINALWLIAIVPAAVMIGFLFAAVLTANNDRRR